MSRLAAIAPRLARAWADRLVELAEERDARYDARERLIRARWLVAHRDLQLARAGHTRDLRYIARRAGKLAAARLELADAERRARALGAWFP